MTFAWVISFLLRGALVLLLCGLCLALARNASAATRRLIAALGLGVCLLVPWALLLPRASRIALPETATEIVTEALSSHETTAVVSAPVANAGAAASAGFGLAELGLFVWGLGVFVCVVRLMASQVRAMNVARRASMLQAGQCYSSEVSSPMVVGLLWPVIVLPWTAEQWTAACLRSVLLHETSHVVRRDGLVLALGQLCCALYWPLPLVWLMQRQLRRECESSADESVLSAGVRASTYAEHLISVARSFTSLPGALAMASQPNELSRRITALLARGDAPKPLSRLRVALTCGAALATLQLAASAAVPPVERAFEPGREPRLQSIAADEAKRLHAELKAERVAIVVLSATDATVLAHWDDRPGASVIAASTLKPLVVASALQAGKIRATDRFDCGNGERAYADATLRDWAPFGELDVSEILARSSNIGISRIFDALGAEGSQQGLAQFGIAWPRVDANTFVGATVAIGQRLVVSTPHKLAAAYAVFAADGEYRGARPNDVPARVLDVTTARAVSKMLERAVSAEHATGKRASIEGVRVAGKTGTSDEVGGSFASFVGIVPADSPRYVIYVGIGSKAELSGGQHAAPAFARIAQRALALP
jgi:beta-lactamase regulating signal transducer with metallopeptidase domain